MESKKRRMRNIIIIFVIFVAVIVALNPRLLIPGLIIFALASILVNEKLLKNANEISEDVEKNKDRDFDE